MRNTCDRLISETNAYGATRTYTYDATGNRTSITDRNGKTRRFTYDARDRLTTETWVGDGRTTTSTYDAAGQLTNISDPDAAYAYTYDPDGRLLAVNNSGTTNSPTVQMSYNYDRVGNVLSAVDTINGTNPGNTTYAYDQLNRLTSMRQSGANVTDKRVDYTYNAVGQPTNVKRFSNLSGTQLVADTNHTFDRLNRLTNISHSRGGTPLAAHTYTYDANSRITGTTNNDGTAAYSYDATDQLTGVDYSYQPDESYTYDANGNRTNPGYVTGKNNRLLSDGKFNYEYDGEGNVIRQTDILSGEVTAYTWDYRNRLTNVTRNGTSVGTYNYDVYDQRIGKTTATGTNRFVYGQNQNIALEFDGSGALTNRYLHGDGIDAIMADEANGSVGWTLTDNLGTVRDVVDGTGASQNHFVYDSFGNVTSETNPSFDTRFTFTGREFDAETGNYDYRNRQLRPSSGRFIEEDPLGLMMMQGEISSYYPRFASPETKKQSSPVVDMNLYRYTSNNPIHSKDPTGLFGSIIGGTDPVRSIFFFTIKNGSKKQDFANNMADIVFKRDKEKYSVQITEDISFAVITFNLIQTGTDASSDPPDKLPKDQNGHIVAKQLGGRGIKNNLFAQTRGINMGQWFGYERSVRQYLDTHPLQLTDCGLVIVGLSYTVFLRNYPFNQLRPRTLASTARFSDGEIISLPTVANF